ncbi:MAG: hypothetical protein OEZ51_15175, partial [Nitrospinota bacterium]|nr:hypothetical protein [Nitrospinota bacterium]
MPQLIEYSRTLIKDKLIPERLTIPVETWVLLGLTLIASAAFLWALWPKLLLLMQSSGENRLDRPAQRLRNTLRIALGQSKMFKDRPAGWMHALIFWGFLILLVRALYFFILGLYPLYFGVIETYGIKINHTFLSYPYYNHSGSFRLIAGSYLIVKDGVVLLVTLACGYALFRRLVRKPKRLTQSWEASLILILILVIMISDIVYDVAHTRFLGDTPPFFLGFILLKTGVVEFSWEESYAVLSAAYWTHVLSILTFLVILPRSKHFHIITSIPNVFLGNVTQTGNQLSRIDFEDESKETFGVTRIEEFSWKKLLDLHTCT